MLGLKSAFIQQNVMNKSIKSINTGIMAKSWQHFAKLIFYSPN